MSVHRFGSEEGAAAGLDYFANILASAGYEEVAVEKLLGDQRRALQIVEDGTTLYALYVRSGKYVYRLGGSNPAGDPAPDVIALAELLVQQATTTGGAPDAGASLPPGIPAGAEAATVQRVVDGFQLRVKVGTTIRLVQLLGVTAAKTAAGERAAECFGPEAAAELAALAPVGSTVHLEAEGEASGDGSPARYVWVANEDGAPAVLLNERLLADGFVTLKPTPAAGKYADRLNAAEEEAREEQRGRWDACEDAASARAALRLQLPGERPASASARGRAPSRAPGRSRRYQGPGRQVLGLASANGASKGAIGGAASTTATVPRRASTSPETCMPAARPR